MLSHNSKVYAKKMALLTPEQQKFVDDVFAMCERNYEEGGDTIVECYDPQDIVKEFTSLDDVRSFCGLKLEQALNARWGEDTDDELTKMKNFEQNW